MSDRTIKRVDSHTSPLGEMGQKYLVSGKRLAMRLWEEAPGEEGAPHTRPYETVGYVVEGKVRIRVGDDVLTMEAGDSYLVPDGAEHHYTVLERLVAVEATAPPARVNDRDDA
ncbi:MAG: cupin domain-containing protein [Rubricoccaceae bacterium]|nr:cupin domain-containing protein [Rubricoccaceae bacterium]